MDSRFTFNETAPGLTISFRAKAVDCGDFFAVDAPRLDTGLLFMVKTGTSCAYTFHAADGIILTVTAPLFITADKTDRRQIRKTPRAVSGVLHPPRFTVRRVSVLRL